MKSGIVLNKRWKEIVFAASGFGPNLLMVLMMAYFTDAVIPTGLNADISFWSYGTSSSVPLVLVSVFVFPILWTIGRIFDGVIDVPLASLTDTLKNKTGKRFLPVLISFIPMVISFVLCWIPVFGTSPDYVERGAEYVSFGSQIGNSIWIFFWSIIFFASYTLCLITFYGSLSEVCSNQTQRARVSAYKSVFDTISYALVYAAIPAIFKAINVPIWQVAIYASPLMLTILIPMLLRNKDPNYVPEINKEANLPMGTSIKLTLKSKPFMKWTIVNCIAFFGLQMFLVAQNALISGIMNLGAGYAAILNTCAFAPVPIMLFFFNKLRRKKGVRFAFQTALLAFAIAILSFGLGSQYIWGDQLMPKLIIGAIGGVVGSWGIGAFFMVPYLIPTNIASVEEEVTGKNHSAMYFAVQALFTSIVGAIASSLIYNYLKLWTAPSASTSISEWKCGVSLVPLIVCIACIAGFFACFFMPKHYSAKVIFSDIKSSAEKEKAHLLKKRNAYQIAYEKKVAEINSLNVSKESKEHLLADEKAAYEVKIAKNDKEIEYQESIINHKFNEEKSSAVEEKYSFIEKESIVANIFLFILSGGIFGLINSFLSLKKFKAIGIKLNGLSILYVFGLFIPFLSIFSNYFVAKKLSNYAKEKGIKDSSKPVVCAVTSIFLPMFFNLANMIVVDICFNNIADYLVNQEN